MKHAILIMAHKNVDYLCRLVKYFDKDCDVFLHIDKKQNIAPDELLRLNGYKQVKLISRAYNVNWGGTSILDCELFLLRTALAQSNADYFHLISGQDYPLRPLPRFLEHFGSMQEKSSYSTCIFLIQDGKKIHFAVCNTIILMIMLKIKRTPDNG